MSPNKVANKLEIISIQQTNDLWYCLITNGKQILSFNDFLINRNTLHALLNGKLMETLKD